MLGCFLTLCLQAAKVEKTTCLYRENPLLVTEPVFSWQMQQEGQGTRQTAYCLEVYQDEAAENLLWSSGKKTTSKSVQVVYEGEKLNATQTYYWRVRIWDEKGTESPWSSMARFTMAPTNAWMDAQWIGAIKKADSKLPEGRDFEGNTVSNRFPERKALWDATEPLSRRSIYLRKAFQTNKSLERAVVYISGLGHYELTLNGKKIGDAEFAPLWSDYDKTVYYNAYDVTEHLQQGENVAGVLLGNGFYNVQGGRYRKLLISFGPPTLFFKMQLLYSDGTKEEILSDASWKYDFSPITYNCIYGGEDYDATLEQAGWDCPHFDDTAWKPVVLQEAPKGILTAQEALPVKVMNYYSPKSQTKTTLDKAYKRDKSPLQVDECLVFDMGQNLSGFPKITIRGKKGDQVKLVLGEAIDKNGAVNQSQSGRPHYYLYTLKGGKDEIWQPRFSYYGFRYIQVEGAVNKGDKNPEGLPVIKNLQSCFVYNSVEEYGKFECSNDLFNRVHTLIRMAVRSNMQAVFTDCPHREKLGWLEQDHLNGEGLLYNADMTLLWPKVMRDMADAQFPNGMIPSIAPMYVEFSRTWLDLPVWGSSALIMPFMYYEQYGDRSLIEKYYPVMRKYVDYLENSSDHHIVRQGLGDWYDFGEKRPGFAQNTPVALVETAYLYYNISLLVKAAKMLGNHYDAAYYTRLGEEVSEAFHREFFRAEEHVYGTGSQTSYALPLFLNMVPETSRQQVLEHLVADIKAHGVRLTTGEVGNKYLFQVLAQNGLNELMYEMHNHEEVPGYGYQLKFGATTLTEQWDPRQGASWNHFMLGAIDEWFFSTLGGIQMDKEQPGGQHLLIRPQPVGDLTYLTCSTKTLYGTVSVSWKRKDNQFEMEVRIPANSDAKVYLPGSDKPQTIQSGTHTFKTIIK